MRRIGQTDQHGDKYEIIVYMTPDEWRTLEMLQCAAQNNVPDDFMHLHWEPMELSHLFSAIREWVSLRFKINRLQMHLDGMRESIEHSHGSR